MAKSRLVAPEPPADLNEIKLSPAAPSPIWYRIVPKERGPLYWSRTGAYRFDSPDAKWGVCYAGESIEASFLEIWGDVIRRRRRIDWQTLELANAWKLTINSSLCIELLSDTLPILGATMQCFVGSYALSQRWAKALMDHPMGLEGLEYLGRRCGRTCIALFGDDIHPRNFQKGIKTEKLGPLTHWRRLFSYADEIGLRISNAPDSPPASTWV